MSEQKTPSTLVTLGSIASPVRFSYLHVFEPKLNTQNNKEEKSVTLLIPKSNTADVEKVKSFLEQVKRELYTSKKKVVPPKWWNPLRDGDKDTKQDGSPLGAECRGHYLLSAKADPDYDVPVVNTTKDAAGNRVRIGPKDIKSGDFGIARVNLYSYVKGDHGCGAGLVTLMLTRQGDSLGGSRETPEQAFADIGDDDIEL